MAQLQQENHQTLKVSIEILKQALPKMTNLDIPPTPENYAVWYEYSLGSSLKLNAQIDKLIDLNQPFSTDLNHQLYVDYIDNDASKMLENTHHATQLLVQRLMGKIESMHSGTAHFSTELTDFQNNLKEHPDVDTLSNLVSALLDETAQVNKSNDDMKSSLNKMNETVETLKQNMATLNEAVLTDQLTGIANRRAFDETLAQLIETYQHESRVFCLMIMDIDHFKIFNDTYGHAVGDTVLTFVGSALTNAIKGEDFVARFGGEEFVILLPDTEYEGGMAVAEHVRKRIGEKKLASNRGKTDMGRVTISIGVAQMNSLDDCNSIIERADKALYIAKETGRNKVVGEQAKMG